LNSLGQSDDVFLSDKRGSEKQNRQCANTKRNLEEESRVVDRPVVRWCESKILSTYVHGTGGEAERIEGDHQGGYSCGRRAEGAAYAIESSP